MIALEFFRFWLMFLVAMFVTKYTATKLAHTPFGPALAYLT